MMKSSGLLLCTILFFCVVHGVTAQPSNVLSAEQQDEMIIIRIDKKIFTCYRYGDGQKYPYFYPVNGPVSGLSLTTESSLPYPHHRSLWFGCDRVNGGNYWQQGNERGQIISRGPKIVINEPNKILIEDQCDWQQPDQQPIILDKREIVITVPSRSVRIIDFTIQLHALTDIKIEKSNHSLFSARMKHGLSVQKNGILINADGQSGEKQTAGQKSPWCDYSGRHFGMVEGLAIFDSPKNPWYPSKWFTRDYGFFSPTNMFWLEQDEFRIKKSESVEFRYRVIVHEGDAKQSNMPALFYQWFEEQTKL